jgi:uncharacterized membrane protein
MWVISVLSLVGVTALCVIGTFHRSYSDNTLQRFGMAGIALAMVSLLSHVIDTHSVSPACSLLSVSLLVFALGVAQKVARFSNETRTEADGMREDLHNRGTIG